MKKSFVALFAFLLVFFLFGAPSAKAGIFGKIIKRASNMESKVSNAQYYTEKEACEIEVKHLDDQVNIEWEHYYETGEKEYDLRRERVTCWREQELVWIDLQECEEERKKSSPETNTDSSSSENSEPESSISSSPSGDLSVFIDTINGTCEEPKTDAKRQECLEECKWMISWRRESLVKVQERIKDVRKAMREDIDRCKEYTEERKKELEECLIGHSVTGTPYFPVEISRPPFRFDDMPPTTGVPVDHNSNIDSSCNTVECRSK